MTTLLATQPPIPAARESDPPRFLELARLLEGIQADAMGELATESLHVADGLVTFAGVGSFVNKTVALGLESAIHVAHVDAIDHFFVARGAEPRIEMTSFADEAVLRILNDKGYRLLGIEHVLSRPIDQHLTLDPEGRTPLALERVDPDDDEAVDAYVRTSWSGFLPDGAEVPPEHFEPSRTVVKRPSNDAFIARIDGAIVGAGGCSTRARVTTLFGVSVLPRYRRRGVQAALIAARLNAGYGRGARLANIVSRPGIPTERNAARLGFSLGYARLVFGRSAPGLVPSA